MGDDWLFFTSACFVAFALGVNVGVIWMAARWRPALRIVSHSDLGEGERQ